VSAARKSMGVKERVLFLARASIYVKIMENAMQTAIDHLPLGMQVIFPGVSVHDLSTWILYYRKR